MNVPTSEDYDRNAEDCWRQAETATDDTERATLVRLAKQWELLAEYKKKLEDLAQKRISRWAHELASAQLRRPIRRPQIAAE
jgi:hypothetical protein